MRRSSIRDACLAGVLLLIPGVPWRPPHLAPPRQLSGESVQDSPTMPAGGRPVRVATMMHESPGRTIEFLGADCIQQDDRMACEFHHAMVFRTGSECAVHTRGFKRVLRRIPDAGGSAGAPFRTWESDPGPPETVCGMRSVITLRSTSVATWWNAMIRWTAPAPNVVDETHCRQQPREQEFKINGKARLPCETIAPSH